jgi:hypothetical protein
MIVFLQCRHRSHPSWYGVLGCGREGGVCSGSARAGGSNGTAIGSIAGTESSICVAAGSGDGGISGGIASSGSIVMGIGGGNADG